MKFNKMIFALLAVAMLSPGLAFSETDELQETENGLEAPSKDPAFAERVESKYKLTDEQMKSMTDAGLHGPQLAMAAQLSASSGKPLADIIKMRTEDKMGWGKIAKELGVKPGEIGQSVASLRRDSHADKDAMKEAKSDRKQLRDEKKAEHRARAEERKEERKEAHSKK